jgi:hypothetical protein
LHDDWVGRIEEVLDDVVVRFEDGSECLVKSADPERQGLPLVHVSGTPL